MVLLCIAIRSISVVASGADGLVAGMVDRLSKLYSDVGLVKTSWLRELTAVRDVEWLPIRAGDVGSFDAGTYRGDRILLDVGDPDGGGKLLGSVLGPQLIDYTWVNRHGLEFAVVADGHGTGVMKAADVDQVELRRLEALEDQSVGISRLTEVLEFYGSHLKGLSRVSAANLVGCSDLAVEAPSTIQVLVRGSDQRATSSELDFRALSNSHSLIYFQNLSGGWVPELLETLRAGLAQLNFGVAMTWRMAESRIEAEVELRTPSESTRFVVAMKLHPTTILWQVLDEIRPKISTVERLYVCKGAEEDALVLPLRPSAADLIARERLLPLSDRS